MIKQTKYWMSRFLQCAALLSALLALSACEDKMVPAGITGYNHMKDHSIADFTVNGGMGSNLSEQSGGGNETCCVSIPRTWRPGMKAEIAWVYDSAQDDPNPPPPPQKAEVEIPKYKSPGKFYVHFYDNHKVKVVVSPCSIEHPFYPMSPQDKLPWKDSFTAEEAIASYKRGGAPYDDC